MIGQKDETSPASAARCPMCGGLRETEDSPPGRRDVKAPGEWLAFLACLPVRVRNSLMSSSISAVEDIFDMTEADFLKIPRFGVNSLIHIRDALLERYGRTLKAGPSPSLADQNSGSGRKARSVSR